MSEVKGSEKTPKLLTPENITQYLNSVYTRSLAWQNSLNKLSEALEVITGVRGLESFDSFEKEEKDLANYLSEKIVGCLEIFTHLDDKNILIRSFPNLPTLLESKEGLKIITDFISSFDEHKNYQKAIKEIDDLTPIIIQTHDEIVTSLRAIKINIMDIVVALEAPAKQD